MLKFQSDTFFFFLADRQNICNFIFPYDCFIKRRQGFIAIVLCVCLCPSVCLLTKYLKKYLTYQLHFGGDFPSDTRMKWFDFERNQPGVRVGRGGGGG